MRAASIHRIASAIAIAACAVLVGACSSASLGAEAACPGGNCPRVVSCTTAACPDQTHVALPTLHIEIRPPADSAYVRTQLLDVPLTNTTNLPIQIPAPVPITLSIVDIENAPIDSTLTLVPKAQIPNEAANVQANFRAASAQTQSVRVVPGTYDAIVTPLDGRPGLETTFTVRPPTGDVVTKEFQITPYRRLTGVVASSVSSDQRFSGVKVVAISDTSGLASTSSITGPDGGYAIDLPDTEDHAFTLVAIPPLGQGPSWSYEEDITVSDMARMKPIPLEPTSEDIRGRATIRIGGSSAGFEPVPGATITLTASRSADLPSRTFRFEGMTDAGGYVVAPGGPYLHDIALLKSIYIADIQPPLNSTFGHTSTIVDLTGISPTNAPMDVQIVLNPKIPVDGSIRSDLGRPVPLAALELRPAGGLGRAVEARTDAYGAFSVLLEPGAYFLVVTPRDATDTNEFPPVSVTKFEVVAGQPHVSLAPIALPKGALLLGSVTGETSGQPVPNAMVEFFYDIGGDVVSLGSTRTNSVGGFSVVLPATIQLQE